jgi:hypothetical protein
MIRSTGAEQPITQNPHPRERVWLAATTNADSPFAAASARRANRGILAVNARVNALGVNRRRSDVSRRFASCQ